MKRSKIDLNADLGEGGHHDSALMQVITSCNIACGGHAGNEVTMRAALSQAKKHDVAAGAHPSFPDRENFGRAHSSLSGAALEEELSHQLSVLKDLATALGMQLKHLKPHGALYNMASIDAGLAASIAKVTQSLSSEALLIGPPNSELEAAAHASGLQFRAEGFADRAYESDGQLRHRSKPGAVIKEITNQTDQALSLALDGGVISFSGERISVPVDTICVHGDTPDAFSAARAIREALEQTGLEVCAL